LRLGLGRIIGELVRHAAMLAPGPHGGKFG
jgi:hypothetical protein